MKRRSDISDVENFLSRYERVKTDELYTSGELFDSWRITAFLGRGGRLCFYDTPDKIFNYFKTHDYFRIFYKLTDEQTTLQYAEKYRNTDYCRDLTEEFKQIYK